MRSRNYLIILIIALPLLFNSCSGKTAKTGDGAVELLCDCFIDAGIENEYDIMDLERDEKQTKKVIKCVLPILKDVRSELDDMDDEDRAVYFADAIKAAVDCDCGVKLLEIAAKMYDTEDVEDGLDDAIDVLEWIGGYNNSYMFGSYGYDYWDEFDEEGYYEEEAYYDDYDDYEYAEPVYEEECYGDYYAMEADLIDLFIENIADGYIVLGETTSSDMSAFIGYSDYFETDYDGMYVSGYFDYDENDVLQSISLDYYYECDGVLEYVEDDKYSIKYAIDYALGIDGEYDEDYEYDYDYQDASVEWHYDEMLIRMANFSDGFAIYIDQKYDY